MLSDTVGSNTTASRCGVIKQTTDGRLVTPVPSVQFIQEIRVWNTLSDWEIAFSEDGTAPAAGDYVTIPAGMLMSIPLERSAMSIWIKPNGSVSGIALGRSQAGKQG